MIIGYWMSQGEAFVFGPPVGITFGMAFFLTFTGAFAFIMLLLSTLSDLGKRNNRFQVCAFLIALAITFDTSFGPYTGGPLNPLFSLVCLFDSISFKVNVTPENSRTGQWVYITSSALGVLVAFGIHACFAWWLPERAGGHPAAHPAAPVVQGHSNLSAPVHRPEDENATQGGDKNNETNCNTVKPDQTTTDATENRIAVDIDHATARTTEDGNGNYNSLVPANSGALIV